MTITKPLKRYSKNWRLFPVTIFIAVCNAGKQLYRYDPVRIAMAAGRLQHQVLAFARTCRLC